MFNLGKYMISYFVQDQVHQSTHYQFESSFKKSQMLFAMNPFVMNCCCEDDESMNTSKHKYITQSQVDAIN